MNGLLLVQHIYLEIEAKGKKWHFSPIWECGLAFLGRSDSYIYDCDTYGNYWIPSIRCNEKFNEKLSLTWLWFMSKHYNDVLNEIDEYIDHIKIAAIYDSERWKGQDKPDYEYAREIADNSEIYKKRTRLLIF